MLSSADIRACDWSGSTPLDYARESENATAERILSGAVDPSARTAQAQR